MGVQNDKTLKLMRRLIIPILVYSMCILSNASCSQEKLTAYSPDEKIKVVFDLNESRPEYSITYNGQQIVLNSAMGFILKDQPSLTEGFEIRGSKITTYDNTWEQVWGEKQTIRNHYNQLRVDLQESDEPGRQMSVFFRVFDNGVGFRYEIPEQEDMQDFVIMEEVTEFAMADDHTAWWIKAYQPDRYEYLYEKTGISEMDTVHTPLTMKTKDGLYLSLHEADLIDYASYTVVSKPGNKLVTGLVPWADGSKVKTSAPMKTPWRTIQIAEDAGDLITNYMVLNLNEPNKLEDLSYIKPSKYMGIWWGMHIGKYTFWESENLGATTENAKRYIDFAVVQ